MSPATKLKERTIQASGQDSRKLTITPFEDGSVVVTWLCGDLRYFTPEDLVEQLRRIAMFADRWPGVWIKDRDSQGRQYAVKVEDGRLYADSSPIEGTQECVSWTNLRNALEATVKDTQEFVNQQQEGS